MEKKHWTIPDSAGQSGSRRLLPRAPSQTLLDALHFIFHFLGWTVRWTGAVIFFVAVMAGVALYVFNQASAGGSYVIVPDVTGLPVTTAANVLAEAGLELGTQQRVRNDRVPQYHVIVQRPRANEVVRAGRKVGLTLSEGEEYLPAPGFLGKPLGDALAELEATQLMAGSVARVPDSRPADTILAQDPPPLRPVSRGSEIHFLVSGGPVKQALMMPMLVGKSLDEAQLILANLNVMVEPYKVDRPGAKYDEVLAQNPEPGTLLNEGQKVSFDVRLRSDSFLPNAQRRVSVQWAVPDFGRPVAVRVETVKEDGKAGLHYPRPEDYVNGRPPLLVAGTLIRFELAYMNEVTVRFYTDGVLHTTYYYQGDVMQPLMTTNLSTPPLLAPDSGSVVEMEELEPAEPANPFTRRPRSRNP